MLGDGALRVEGGRGRGGAGEVKAGEGEQRAHDEGVGEGEARHVVGPPVLELGAPGAEGRGGGGREVVEEGEVGHVEGEILFGWERSEGRERSRRC